MKEGHDYIAAEDLAKAKKLRIWVSYDPNEEAAKLAQQEEKSEDDNRGTSLAVVPFPCERTICRKEEPLKQYNWIDRTDSLDYNCFD